MKKDTTNNGKSKNNDMFKIGVDPRANDEDFQAEQSREAKIAMEKQLSPTPSRDVSVIEVMHKIEVDTGQDMPILEILRKAEEAGIAYDKTEEVIALMKRDGILYSPAEGVVTFAR